MNKSSQYCWKKNACQRSQCKFIHPRDSGSQLHQEDTVTAACTIDSTSDNPLQKLVNNKVSDDALNLNQNAKQLEKQTASKRHGKDIAASQVSGQPTVVERELKRDEPKLVQGYQNNEYESSNTKDSYKQPHQKAKNRKESQFLSFENASNQTSSSEHPDGSISLKTSVVGNNVQVVENSGGSVTSNHPDNAVKSSQKKDDKKTSGKNIGPSQIKHEPTKIQSEPKEKNFDENQHGQKKINTKDSGNISKKICRFRSNCKNASCEFSHSEDPRSNKSIRKQSFGIDRRSEVSNRFQDSQKVLAKVNATSNNQARQIQFDWEEDESIAIKQHRDIIGNIKDKISQIILSEDYSSNCEKDEQSVRILRSTIIELESHISIFDSVKSRACRELLSKPRELCNQIYREIYRLKCRLGAFAKRLCMEKYFTSGHRFLIVQGQTGSGKSTQIPQYVADHPRFYGQKIICTQPRKLAAISLSRRVSFEYSGGIVRNDSHSYIGYQVGGDKRQNNGCRIEFVTEGIMLERIMKGDVDAFKNVGCIIIDEAHERSITCDLLLGSFKKSDPRWNDILIITTSATIDLNLFSEFFYSAPIVQIEGRTFPVDIVYQPVTDEANVQYSVAQCAFQIHFNCKSSPGDILCFLPGLEDLLNAKSHFEKELKKVNGNTGLLVAKVFTLYGKQDPDKQAEVFEKFDPSTTRKIIFATDVAETSITIDGVVYVVDSGVKKEIVFDPERNISSLKINSISKSSAIQRAGRCGRTQPGVCYRLYSQDEFESMNINAAPEVLCKPISLAVLTLLKLSVDPIDFDWISQPSKEAIANAEKELTILGAVDSNRKPTELGNLIATCQQDPKIMKIVYSGCLKGFGEAACNVASILSVSNMFFWNGNDAESKAKAIELRKQLAKPEGDIVTMYRIFEDFNNIYNGRVANNSETIPKSEGIATSNPKKLATLWCRDNSINGKAIFLALAAKSELISQLTKTKIWSKFRSQKKLPTNLEVQELMCSGYFPQSARVFYSKNINAPMEYFSTESEVAGRLDFRSSLKLLDVQPPAKWIVYDRIVRLPNTIFPVASVMDENWLKEANPDFYAMCLKKTENLPTDVIVKSISQVSFRMIVGKNFCNVDSLEKELGCLLTGDADTGQMHLYCAPVKKVNVEQQIQSKIEEALMEIKKQVVEEEYIGDTRVVVGEGYEVHEILFENEFATFYIKNIKKDFDKAFLKSFLSVGNASLASLDCTYQDKTYTAVAKFSSKKDAKEAYELVLKLMMPQSSITVSPSFGTSSHIRHGLTCRLKLTWPTATSKGIANIFFQTAEGANNFLEDVHHIYPSVIVHVCGETQRSAQRKLRGERPNIIQPPLTYLKLPRYDQRCRFRFDSSAIDNMPNKQKLNYKVILTGLKLSTDNFELMKTLNIYNPKNVNVEYEDIVVPDYGNGLRPEEKAFKLKPLSRFMEANTRTTDFFKRNTGLAGICVFLTNNSTAKEAYNYAKPLYDAMKVDSSLQPHRLEIEFTHMLSIQIGLYTFLQPQMTELHKEARSKGITSVTTPIRDNSKTVIIRFHTSHHSLLAWIQEKLDEMTRPTKFNCPNVDVLFKWTGHQELMKLAKKTYINWSDTSQIIWVYGSLEHKEKTCKDIEKLADYLKSLDVLDQEICLNKTVRINGKQGRNISTKCKEERVAFYHFNGNRMYISGSKKSVDAVVQFLLKNNYSWDRSKRNRIKYEETRDCGLCGMPPDDTFIMLSVCGHLFCSDCIEPMIKMQPPPFPIKCPSCEEFVALHDIRKLAPTKSLEKVLEMAVRQFQEDHSHDIRLCPNPGCSQLLSYQQRTTGTNGGEFLFCDECIATYCINCSEKMSKPIKSHEDDSCENVQSGVSNLVFKHVRIIQETIFNLSCPNCNVAFYEFDGCAAVTCSNCKAGFCGLCLLHCGKDAHSHVPHCTKNPGKSVYVEKAQLDAAHLGMRNEKFREYLEQHMNSKVQQKVIQSIRKDLIDLGMDVPNISASTNDESSEAPIDILQHVRNIQENILTLSCPNCTAAYYDFDGYAAVTCTACQEEFCLLCLRFCGNDVFIHVANCIRNPTKGNYFFNSNELVKVHAAVRTENLQTYLANEILDTKNKEKVLSMIRRDLNDLQIELPIIPPPRRVRAAEPVVFQRIREEPIQQERPHIALRVREQAPLPPFAYNRIREEVQQQLRPPIVVQRVREQPPPPPFAYHRMREEVPPQPFGHRIRPEPVRRPKKDCCIL